ncbi:MAG: Lrp/AsnC family transcriptional regulator [Mangrovicoccus sp.]|nr:Lrp/AsnC family transcriptional regulator [Mangrovicoccus sp.]
MKIDEIDRKILALLQEDASMALDALGAAVGLSRNACWRRVKALDASGVIRKRVTLLSPEKLGVGLMVFISVKAGSLDAAWQETFQKEARAIPEVLGVYRLSGSPEYLLQAQVANVEGYNLIRQRLVDKTSPSEVNARFVLEEVKNTRALPV